MTAGSKPQPAREFVRDGPRDAEVCVRLDDGPFAAGGQFGGGEVVEVVDGGTRGPAALAGSRAPRAGAHTVLLSGSRVAPMASTAPGGPHGRPRSRRSRARLGRVGHVEYAWSPWATATGAGGPTRRALALELGQGGDGRTAWRLNSRHGVAAELALIGRVATLRPATGRRRSRERRRGRWEA
ncbi:hypothetical protein O1M63_08170 [Streptomyces mirabilis]|nr:hypothetical protein [Streptomyces mirabilis]